MSEQKDLLIEHYTYEEFNELLNSYNEQGTHEQVFTKYDCNGNYYGGANPYKMQLRIKGELEYSYLEE